MSAAGRGLIEGRVIPLAGILLCAAAVGVGWAQEPGGQVAWVEDFADDAVAAGRFSIPPAHASERFTYDAQEQRLTVHYDTGLPTAWYMRPIDAVSGRTFGRYDDFSFAAVFRVRSAGFYVDPDGFAQIAWGLVNSQTTGDDRSGGGAGPYAYDCVTFDFFPNVSPLYGGPTLGPTVIHSDDGAGYFWNIDFAFGAESRIDEPLGDESIQFDTVYTAWVSYDGSDQIATLTIHEGAPPVAPLLTNTDGAGGAGGSDGDPATIQTFLFIDHAFTVDTFAITAWQDMPGNSSVIADVDVLQLQFFAPAVLFGDMNLDGMVNGLDVGPFLALMLSPDPDPDLVARGDADGNGTLDPSDVDALVEALLNS